MMKYLLVVVFILASAIFAEAQHSVDLAWTASVDTGVTYNIYRAPMRCALTNPASFAQVNPAPITALTYTDPIATPGTYSYEATAVLGGLQSIPSNKVRVDVLVGRPTSLTVIRIQ